MLKKYIMEFINESLNIDIFNKVMEFNTLRLKVHIDMEKLKKSQPNLFDDDLRIYYFIQIDNILLDTGIAYKLSEHLNTSDWWKDNYPQCKKEEILKRIEIFHKSIALNLLNLAFSLTEDTFRQLIRNIKPNACNSGKSSFESIYKCLLKELKVTYNDSLFKLFRLTRNCFHNNGFYYPESNTNSEEVIYRNVKYYFPYAQKVIYPSGLPILEIISDLTSLYAEMVESETLIKNFSLKKA